MTWKASAILLPEIFGNTSKTRQGTLEITLCNPQTFLAGLAWRGSAFNYYLVTGTPKAGLGRAGGSVEKAAHIGLDQGLPFTFVSF